MNNNKEYLFWWVVSIVSLLVSVWFIVTNTGGRSLTMGIIMLSLSIALCVITYFGKATTGQSAERRPISHNFASKNVSLTMFDSSKSKKIWVFALFLVIFIGYVIAGPYLTMYKLKSAIVEKDAEGISQYIDFPALRQNLKAQFNKSLVDNASSELAGNPFAGFAVALSTQLVDGMINSFMTPEGLAGLMGGGKTYEKKKSTQNTKEDPELFKEASFVYESISKFSVSIPVENDESVKIILTRNGLSWKVVDLIFPMDHFNMPKEPNKSNKVKVSKRDYKIQEAFSRMDAHSTTLNGLASRCQIAIELDINVQEKCKNWKKVADAWIDAKDEVSSMFKGDMTENDLKVYDPYLSINRNLGDAINNFNKTNEMIKVYKGLTD